MDRHNNEALAMIEKMKGLWNKQEKMSDVQRAVANGYALGIVAGRQLQRGDKNDERKQQKG